MRNPILAVAVAFTLVAPNIGLADQKKAPTKTTKPTPTLSIDGVKGESQDDRHSSWIDRTNKKSGPQIPGTVGGTSTVNPALQGNELQKGPLGGSTGPNLKRMDGGGTTIGRHQ